MKLKEGRNPMPVSHGKQFKIGNFTILPFNVNHDCQEPLGFLIHHPQTGKILFLTDSFYSNYIFSGLSHVLVECNFADDILDKNLSEGKVPSFIRNRILNSHMSLNTCKDLLSANDLSNVDNIILLHLSSQNANAKQFKSEVEAHTGKVVNIATKGLTINLNKGGF